MSDLTQWTYKRSHAITSGTELTDYQIKIRVYRTEGTSTGDTVYLGSKCLADYGDIRFVASDDTTELSYWMETNAGTYADFWVKVPSISDTTIWIYYGNASASTTSNGDDTFEFFDDFSGSVLDSNKWTINSGSPTISNSIVTISAATILGKTSFGIGYSFRSKVKFSHVNNASSFMSIGFGDNAITYPCHGSSTYRNKHTTANTSYIGWVINIPITVNSWYISEISRVSTSTVKFYKDDVLDNTATSQIPEYNLPPKFRADISSYKCDVDWIIIRKCSTIEPIHTTWSDETPNIYIPLLILINPTSGMNPLSIKYTIRIQNTLNDFKLIFGDRKTHTLEEVTDSFTITHIYETPGTYTVFAEGYDEDGNHVFYEIPYGVTVSAPSVVASFTTSQSYNTITFTNTSTGNINECYWDFGDGNHSYEQNPTHTYYSPATYTVTLYASNQYQYDYTTNDITITQILTAPDAYFTPAALNVINPTLPYSVTFTNLSTPAFGCTYNWLIDGTSYTTQNATHSFTTYGMYDVGLTVTNALGSATKTYNDAIRITRKGKTFYEVINYADTPATFHVEVFNEVATSADTVIQAHIFDESINFVQDEIPDEPGLDEWGMRHFYSSINEWGHRIISAVTDWGNRILYNGSTLDNSPVTLFKAQEFREDLVLSDEWQFGTE